MNITGKLQDCGYCHLSKKQKIRMNTELEDQILLKMCIFDDLAHHFTLEQ